MKIKARIKRHTLFLDKFPVGTNVYITDCEYDAYDSVWYHVVNPSNLIQTDIVEPSALEILNKSQRNLMHLRLYFLLNKLEDEY